MEINNITTENGKLSKSEKHQKLLEMLRSLSTNDFTGYIKVNFSQGGIGRIEKFEEITLKRGSQPE